MDGQTAFYDVEAEKYTAFTGKFQPKLTTDASYTPERAAGAMDKDAAKACLVCAYLGGPPCRSCDYILITGHRRGCPGGAGCLRFERRKRHENK